MNKQTLMEQFSLSPDEVKKHLFPFVLAGENAENAWPDCPYRLIPGTDLALFSMALLKDRAAAVSREFAALLSLSEEELFFLSIENQLHAPFTLRPLSELLSLPEDPDIPILVLSNVPMIMGAGEILNEKALFKASEQLGEEFLILPSSRHEVLLVPKEDMETGSLRRLVLAVNKSAVRPEDRLTDSIYAWSRVTGMLSML